jgi:hypothetical protein
VFVYCFAAFVCCAHSCLVLLLFYSQLVLFAPTLRCLFSPCCCFITHAFVLLFFYSCLALFTPTLCCSLPPCIAHYHLMLLFPSSIVAICSHLTLLLLALVDIIHLWLLLFVVVYLVLLMLICALCYLKLLLFTLGYYCSPCVVYCSP